MQAVCKSGRDKAMKKKKCFVIILDTVKNNARQSDLRAAFNLIKLEVETWQEVTEPSTLTRE